MTKKVFDPVYMRKEYPSPPKKILAQDWRGAFGVISPSRLYYHAGDEDVQEWDIEIKKWLVWERRISKTGWKALRRAIRRQPDGTETNICN